MTKAKKYDRLNRLQSISSTPGAANSNPFYFGYQYNDANQRTRGITTDGSYWEYRYDSLGQVTSGDRFWADGAAVEAQQRDYAYDDIGNRTSVNEGGNQLGGARRSLPYQQNLLNQITTRSNATFVDIVGASSSASTVTVNSSNADYRRGPYFREELTAGK